MLKVYITVQYDVTDSLPFMKVLCKTWSSKQWEKKGLYIKDWHFPFWLVHILFRDAFSAWWFAPSQSVSSADCMLSKRKEKNIYTTYRCRLECTNLSLKEALIISNMQEGWFLICNFIINAYEIDSWVEMVLSPHAFMGPFSNNCVSGLL